jgi:extradiol dioxygenase family protein
VDPHFVPATKAHPAFVVDDYEGLVSRLESAGVTIRPDDTIRDRRRCHVDDPVGNRIELIDGANLG